MQGSSLRTDQASLGICTIALIQDQGNMLLDTGHFGTRRQILEALKKLGVRPVDIDRVILSMHIGIILSTSNFSQRQRSSSMPKNSTMHEELREMIGRLQAS
jgi:metal-dependent hydrolase (beta-lactamase superfamily II)